MLYGAAGGLDRSRDEKLLFPTPTEDDIYGATVSGVGDLDGDGFADFAVGDPQDGDQTGAVDLYFGGPTLTRERRIPEGAAPRSRCRRPPTPPPARWGSA